MAIKGKTPVTYKDSLPARMVSIIENSDLKKIHKAKTYKLIGLFFKWIAHQEIELTDYKPIPYSYLLEAYPEGRHTVWLKKLKTLNIIQVRKYNPDKESYMPGGFCKAYRLNPALVEGKFQDISYTLSQAEDTDHYVMIKNEKWDVDFLKEDYRSLILCRRELLALAKKIANNISESKFLINVVVFRSIV
jgi:hypothetical protein